MLKRKVLSICLLIVLAVPLMLFSDEAEGELTLDLIKKYREEVKKDSSLKVKINALTNNKITELAKNYDVLNSYDFHFSKKLEMYRVTNQNRSGRCWLYAGLNLLRRDIAKKLKMKDFELSHTYNYFFDKMEKANMFLEYMIKYADRDFLDRDMRKLLRNPIYDGGQWNMVVRLINKYGVVPKSAMGETVNSENSRYMVRIIARKLKRDAIELRKLIKQGKSLKELRATKEKMLAEVYKLLVVHLGEPPSDFIFRYEDKDGKLSAPKKYTPHQFLEKLTDVRLEEYIMFYNDPRYDYRKLYQINLDRNMFDGEDLKYINLSMKDMKSISLKSILSDEPIWFGADVGKQSDREKGILSDGLYQYCKFLGVCLCMDKKDRINYYEQFPTHAMVITGVDTQGTRPIKWLVENSWGTENGKDGYFVMYDKWFDEYLLAVVVHKRFVPKDIQKILDTEPTVLPSWDPMFEIISMRLYE